MLFAKDSLSQIVCVAALLLAACGERGDPVGAEASAMMGEASDHPLDPLSGKEIKDAFTILGAYLQAHHPGQGVLYPALHLQEPPKAQVLAWKAGGPRPARRAFAQVFLNRTALHEAIVNLKQDTVDVFVARPGVQPPVAATEYNDADALMRGNPDWQSTMAARGINPEDVYLDAWAPGETEGLNEVVPNQPGCAGTGPRYLRALSFRKNTANGRQQLNPYDRPIEGVIVTLDMTHLCVAQVVDCHGPPALQPARGGCYLAGQPAPGISRTRGSTEPRTDTRPLQVKGDASYSIEGHAVTWQKWRFRFGLHFREGLFLYDVGFEDEQGGVRDIAYRIGMAEVYVPYGVPDVNWLWRSAFDIGEYNLGQYAIALEANRTVPAHTSLVGTVFPTDTGDKAKYPDVIGIYERDGSPLWVRVDPSDYKIDARLARELVVTYTAWIGNYLYGIEYIFGMDGALQVKTNLLGTTLNQGVNTIAQGDAYGATTLVDPDNGAIVAMPNHQHFFNYRLDLDIDGPKNHVEESNTQGAGLPDFPNAFHAVETPIAAEGWRDAAPLQNRSWMVASNTQENALGHHTGYAIVTRDTAVPYSHPEFGPLRRAQYANHAFWVTTHRDDERYAGGDYPNQGEPGKGLPEYVNGEPLGPASDPVIWLTVGATHHPHPEEFPTMNLQSISFHLMPHGFHSRNPALDAPLQDKKDP